MEDEVESSDQRLSGWELVWAVRLNPAAGNGVCILPNSSNSQTLCHELFSLLNLGSVGWDPHWPDPTPQGFPQVDRGSDAGLEMQHGSRLPRHSRTPAGVVPQTQW